MPVCPVCESEEYEVINGLYYCQICSTQSQEVVQEELDDFHALAGGRSIDKKKSSKNAKVDHGKPWFTVEGYQVILRAQVDALIELGCTPALSDIVKQIWLKYVQKSGLACIDPSSFQESNRSLVRTFRDEFLDGVFEPEAVDVDEFPCRRAASIKLRRSVSKGSRKRRKSYSSSEEENDFEQKKLENENEKLSKKESIFICKSDEEWLSLASNLDSSDNPEFSEGYNPKFKNQYRRPVKRATEVMAGIERDKINYLHLPKVLAILAVGVQWCEEPITIGDLIAWMKQGILPLFDTVSCLLPHMKLTDFDMLHFTAYSIPTYKKLVYMADRVIRYVEMLAMPDVDIQQLVARYVVQLNLPYALVSFIKFMSTPLDYGRHVRNFSGVSVYVPELVAFALVIIGLKILFGLDDVTEWKADDEAHPCCHDDDDEDADPTHICKPFLWRSWCRFHLKRREEITSSPDNHFISRDVDAFGDIHSMQEHWMNVVLRSTMATKEAPTIRRKLEKFKTKKWTFEKLCEAQGSKEEMEQREERRKSIPFVFPRASEDSDMSDHCLLHVISKMQEEGRYLEYVRYIPQGTRVESGHKSRSRGFDLSSDFHDSYEFVMSLAQEMVCAPVRLIHSVILEVERIVCGELTPLQTQPG